MNTWNRKGPIPAWVEKLTDEEIVERFYNRVYGRFAHEQVGRDVRNMRKRLYKILIDGLAAQKAKEAHQ